MKFYHSKIGIIDTLPQYDINQWLVFLCFYIAYVNTSLSLYSVNYDE